MGGKRKVYTAAFQAQVSLAPLKRDRTANELAGRYGVHPTLIHAWKKKLLNGAEVFTGILEAAGVAVSMDGRGRALDNVFVERLPGSVNYEGISIQGDETVPALHRGLARHFAFDNVERLQSVARLPDPGGRLPGHEGPEGLTRE